jgi:hypothetical protein
MGSLKSRDSISKGFLEAEDRRAREREHIKWGQINAGKISPLS